MPALAQLLPAVPAPALADFFALVGALGDAPGHLAVDPRLLAGLTDPLGHPAVAAPRAAPETT